MSPKILLVDSNQENLAEMAELFAQYQPNCDLVLHESLDAADSQLAQERFDVIVLDYSTAGPEVESFLGHVAEGPEATPVVILASSADELTRVAPALENKVSAVVTKENFAKLYTSFMREK